MRQYVKQMLIGLLLKEVRGPIASSRCYEKENRKSIEKKIEKRLNKLIFRVEISAKTGRPLAL